MNFPTRLNVDYSRLKTQVMGKTIMISLLLLMATCASAQMTLKNEAIPLKPYGYFIAGVQDDRSDPIVPHELVLPGGTAKAIQTYFQRNLSKDPAERPVIISIKEFKLTESKLQNGNADGQIKLRVSFGLEKNYGIEHLVDYSGGLHYVSQQSSTINVERYLRSMLEASLLYLNNWIKEREKVNRKLAKGVRITVSDYTETKEGDTIYYSAKRPLQWTDFQSRLRPSNRFSATVIPSIGYEQTAEMIDGIIEVKIAMKTYLPKSASWASSDSRNAYTLNHEQRHFDIVKIIAEQFKQKLVSATLTPDNFEAFINMQYLDYFRAMDAMQKAYDLETRHGTNTAAQQAWNTKIDQALANSK